MSRVTRALLPAVFITVLCGVVTASALATEAPFYKTGGTRWRLAKHGKSADRRRRSLGRLSHTHREEGPACAGASSVRLHLLAAPRECYRGAIATAGTP